MILLPCLLAKKTFEESVSGLGCLHLEVVLDPDSLAFLGRNQRLEYVNTTNAFFIELIDQAALVVRKSKRVKFLTIKKSKYKGLLYSSTLRARRSPSDLIPRKYNTIAFFKSKHIFYNLQLKFNVYTFNQGKSWLPSSIMLVYSLKASLHIVCVKRSFARAQLKGKQKLTYASKQYRLCIYLLRKRNHLRGSLGLVQSSFIANSQANQKKTGLFILRKKNQAFLSYLKTFLHTFLEFFSRKKVFLKLTRLKRRKLRKILPKNLIYQYKKIGKKF
jgi:hypothetical protein